MAAMVERGGYITALEVDRPGQLRFGAILSGHIRNTDAAGTFIDLGPHGEGFMDASKAPAGLPSGSRHIVQVKAEAFRSKLPSLSSSLSLPGRFCIHLPGESSIFLSRRAKDIPACAGSKTILQESGLPGGFILRAQASQATEAALLAEASFLSRLGQNILEKGQSFSGMSAPMRIITDVPATPEQIISTLPNPFLKDWLEGMAPDLSNRLVYESAGESFFESLGLCDSIDGLLARTVPIPGGNLVIEPTEALVAIDINSGAAPKTAFCMDAAREIARQVRLRNLSGMIVMDFPRLPAKEDAQRIMEILRHAAAEDPCNFDIAGYSPLRLLEATRTRRTPSLSECVA